MAYVTESWGDRELARMRGFDQALKEYYRCVFGPAWEEALEFALKYAQKKEDEMHILYDLVDVQGSETRGSYTACRVCGSVVTVTDHEKHDEWHAKLDASTGYQPAPPPEPENFGFGVFGEGTGVAVSCPHCGGMNCTFRGDDVQIGEREAALPFRCTTCENKFTVKFSGTPRWTGMVTESTS